MKKVRIPQPWEGPLAFKRVFWSIVVVLLIVGTVATIQVLSTPTPKREKLNTHQLSTQMATALLSVREINMTVLAQNGYPGGTIRADENGNYEIDAEGTTPSLDADARTVGSHIFFKYGRQAIVSILISGANQLSESRAKQYASIYANQWFATDVETTKTHEPPAPASSARALFTSLGVGSASQFSTEPPVTVSNVLTIPLATGEITWFIPATGSILPNEIVLSGTNSIPLFNTGSGMLVTYSHHLLSRPTHVLTPPKQFSQSWNQVVTSPGFGDMTPTGLIWETITG